MTAQSQPPIPPAAGLYGSPGSPNSASSASSAPSAGSADEPGKIVIQGTEVIDATGSDTSAVETTDVPADGDDTDQPTSPEGVPVEPIPPVSDPEDDPVVAAAESDGSDDPSTDANQRSTDDHDSDRLNDPRL